MRLKSPNRMKGVDILALDYEYVTIERTVTDGKNDMGEPEYANLQVGVNIKCAIDPLSNRSQSASLKIFPQGEVQKSTHIMFLSEGQDVRPKDRVIDHAGREYVVVCIAHWCTHKEALLESAG